MRRGGFTLIELMVVIVLMVILTAVILPEMRGTFEGAVLRSTARKLVSAMSMAHSRAITLQQMHRVVLDPNAGRFVIERTAREGEGGRYASLSDLPGGAGDLDKRIAFDVRREGEGDRGAFSFYANGTADPAEIVLRDREGFRLALRINPVTARISVQDM